MVDSTGTYADTFSDGDSHETVAPLQREFVDATVQLLHGDSLRIQHKRVDRLIEVIVLFGRVKVGQRGRQNL